MPVRRKCARCERNRDLRFYAPDRRRSDGLSTVCVSCKKKRRQATGRNQRLVDTYQITQAEYDKLLRRQGGVCAICGGRRSHNLDVDHDHAREKTHGVRASVRGLLCRRCNRRLLPACLNDVAVLQRAIEYLLDPPAQQVL